MFSVVPNSMADERNGSAMTKANGSDRNGLKPDTIVRLVQLRQHYLREDNKVSLMYRFAGNKLTKPLGKKAEAHTDC